MKFPEDWNLLVCMLEAYKHNYQLKAKHMPPEWIEQTIKSDIDPWIKYAKEQEVRLKNKQVLSNMHALLIQKEVV